MKLKRPRVTGKAFTTSQEGPLGTPGMLIDVEAEIGPKVDARIAHIEGLADDVDADGVNDAASDAKNATLAPDAVAARAQMGIAASEFGFAETLNLAVEQLRADITADGRYAPPDKTMHPVDEAAAEVDRIEDSAEGFSAGIQSVVASRPGPAGPKGSAVDATLEWADDVDAEVAVAEAACLWAAGLDQRTPPTAADVSTYRARFVDGESAAFASYVLRVVARQPGLHPALIATLALSGDAGSVTPGEADVAIDTLTERVGEEQRELVEGAWDEDPETLTQVAGFDELPSEAGGDTVDSLDDTGFYERAVDALSEALEGEGAASFPAFEGTSASRAISASLRLVGALTGLERAISAAYVGSASPVFGPTGGSLSVEEATGASILPRQWSLTRTRILHFVAEAHPALENDARALPGILAAVDDLDDRVLASSTDNPDVAMLVETSLIEGGAGAAEALAVIALSKAANHAVEVHTNAHLWAARHTAANVAQKALGRQEQGVLDHVRPSRSPDLAELDSAMGPVKLIAMARSLDDLSKVSLNTNRTGGDVAGALANAAGLVLDGFDAMPADLKRMVGQQAAKGFSRAPLDGAVDALAVKAMLDKLNLAYAVLNAGVEIYRYGSGEGTDKTSLIGAAGGLTSAALAVAAVPGVGTTIAGLTLAAQLSYGYARAWWFSDTGKMFGKVADELGGHHLDLISSMRVVSGAATRMVEIAAREENGTLTAYDEKALAANLEMFQREGCAAADAFATLEARARKRLDAREVRFSIYRSVMDNDSGLNEGGAHAKQWDKRFKLLPTAFNSQMALVSSSEVGTARRYFQQVKTSPSDPTPAIERLKGFADASGAAFQDLHTVMGGIMADKNSDTIAEALAENHVARMEARQEAATSGEGAGRAVGRRRRRR